MLESFYATAAQLSFTLLGLWWVVVQFKHAEWMADPRRRRMAYDVSLVFLLPGLMSLTSLMAERNSALWRVGFAVAGVLGVLEAAAAIRAVRPAPSTFGQSAWLIRGVNALLYLVVVVVAVDPTVPQDLGLNLTGRESEAVALSLLLFLAVNLVWMMFVESPSTPAFTSTAPRSEAKPGEDVPEAQIERHPSVPGDTT
jgi:hypothetical protein